MDAEAREATRARIYEALHDVLDPELGVNVVDLGLVYGVQVREDGTITVTMTLTTPGCPMHESLAEAVAQALGRVPGVTGGDLELVWNPPWDPSMMTAQGKALLGWTA